MDIAKKYEDVVAERDAALAREDSLREELDRTKKAYEAYGIDFDRSEEKAAALQQLLTVAEHRAGELESEVVRLTDLAAANYEAWFIARAERDRLIATPNPPTATGIPAFAYCSAALKPAAEGDGS